MKSDGPRTLGVLGRSDCFVVQHAPLAAPSTQPRAWINAYVITQVARIRNPSPSVGKQRLRIGPIDERRFARVAVRDLLSAVVCSDVSIADNIEVVRLPTSHDILSSWGCWYPNARQPIIYRWKPAPPTTASTVSSCDKTWRHTAVGWPTDVAKSGSIRLQASAVRGLLFAPPYTHDKQSLTDCSRRQCAD